MARRVFPDEAYRLAYQIRPDNAFGTAGNLPAVAYADEAKTSLADIRTEPGGVSVPGSVLTVDVASGLPDFQGPDGDVGVVYVSVNGGPVKAVRSRSSDRIAAVEVTANAAETPAGAQAKADAAQAAAIATAGDDPRLTGALRQHGVAAGLTQAAVGAPKNVAYLLGVGVTSGGYRIQHVAQVAASDFRLLFMPPNGAEVDLSNALQVEAWIEYPVGVLAQCTFAGRRVGYLEPGGSLLSDPVPVDTTAGTTFWSRVWVTTPFGASTTLAASSSVGAASLSVTAAPPSSMSYPFDLVVDTGGNKEIVSIGSVTGSGPYTYNLATGTTAAKAHASGVAVGQEIVGNYQVLSDRSEGQTGSRATVATGTFPSLGTTTAPTNAAASIGDVSVSVTTQPQVPPSGVVTLDTAGNAETLTVKNIYGTGSPWTVVFTTPLTKAHASGVNLISSGANSGLSPAAVVADRVLTRPTPVVLVGDSIISGQGYWGRTGVSFATLALDAVTRPYIFISKGGETGQTFAVAANSIRRRKMLGLAASGNWCIYEYGTNDIYAARSLAQVQADTTSIVTSLRTRGLRVAMTTLTPRTTSTDNFATTVNQTLANAGFETVRLAYNAWVRAGAGGLADLVIDTAGRVDAGVVAGGVESGLWLADSGGPYTIDGIHPSVRGHVLMSAAVTAALPSLT